MSKPRSKTSRPNPKVAASLKLQWADPDTRARRIRGIISAWEDPYKCAIHGAAIRKNYRKRGGKKLTSKDAAEMRRLFPTLGYKAVARRYNVSVGHVYRVVSGYAWSI